MPQDVSDRVDALACYQGAAAGLNFSDCHGIPQDPHDFDSDDDDHSFYNSSNHGFDDSSASSDADDDLNLTINAINITGVAEHDEEDEEPNDNDDGYIEIAGVNNNTNNNELMGVDANEHPPNDNYYPQDFYDEAVNDDDVPETKDEAIHLDHPN